MIFLIGRLGTTTSAPIATTTGSAVRSAGIFIGTCTRRRIAVGGNGAGRSFFAWWSIAAVSSFARTIGTSAPGAATTFWLLAHRRHLLILGNRSGHKDFVAPYYRLRPGRAG